MRKNRKKTDFIISGILAVFLLMPVAAAGGDKGEDTAPDHIVSVDIPYDLFLSLARYEALSEAEARGKSVDAKILPVLQQIIAALDGELKKFKALAGTAPPTAGLSSRVRKLEGLIGDFRTEQTLRRKELELHRLLEEQKSLMERE